jgi:hypothetical protein
MSEVFTMRNRPRNDSNCPNEWQAIVFSHGLGRQPSSEPGTKLSASRSSAAMGTMRMLSDDDREGLPGFSRKGAHRAEEARNLPPARNRFCRIPPMS